MFGEENKVVGYHAKCDICHSEVSKTLLTEIVTTTCEDEEYTAAQEQAARNRLYDTSGPTTRRCSDTLPSTHFEGLKVRRYYSYYFPYVPFNMNC